MDETDPLLSHQLEAVIALSSFFPKVKVITGHQGFGNIPKNVIVSDLKWKSRNSFQNVLNFYRESFKVIFKSDLIVFSHMTDVQAALVSPFLRLRGHKHYLWYAHKSHSVYLRWSSFWVNGIVTSTAGSCPVKGKKVYPVGQALNPKSFEFSPQIEGALLNGIHIGRFDKSKNLIGVAEGVITLRNQGFDINLTQIGDPTTEASIIYEQDFRNKYQNYIDRGIFSLQPSLPRVRIAEELKKNDFFMHAYLGSLDKTLLEATLVGLPVITLNNEYRKLFGTWSELANPTLAEEFQALAKMSASDLYIELVKRRIYVEKNHSLSNWISSLMSIFCQE